MGKLKQNLIKVNISWKGCGVLRTTNTFLVYLYIFRVGIWCSTWDLENLKWSFKLMWNEWSCKNKAVMEIFVTYLFINYLNGVYWKGLLNLFVSLLACGTDWEFEKGCLVRSLSNSLAEWFASKSSMLHTCNSTDLLSNIGSKVLAK